MVSVETTSQQEGETPIWSSNDVRLVALGSHQEAGASARAFSWSAGSLALTHGKGAPVLCVHESIQKGWRGSALVLPQGWWPQTTGLLLTPLPESGLRAPAHG